MAWLTFLVLAEHGPDEGELAAQAIGEMSHEAGRSEARLDSVCGAAERHRTGSRPGRPAISAARRVVGAATGTGTGNDDDAVAGAMQRHQGHAWTRTRRSHQRSSLDCNVTAAPLSFDGLVVGVVQVECRIRQCAVPVQHVASTSPHRRLEPLEA